MDKLSVSEIALLKKLTMGTPREQWLAKQQLTLLDKDIESPLRDLLNQTQNENTKADILMILSSQRITCSRTVQVITRHLNHKKEYVRYYAASALLHASPKLRLVMPELRNAIAKETNQSIRQMIQKLLDRYPND